MRGGSEQCGVTGGKPAPDGGAKEQERESEAAVSPEASCATEGGRTALDEAGGGESGGVAEGEDGSEVGGVTRVGRFAQERDEWGVGGYGKGLAQGESRVGEVAGTGSPTME